MSQNLVPNADVAVAGWNPTPLHARLGANDGSEVQSPPGAGVFESVVALAAGVDPGIHSGHGIVVGARATNAATVGLTVVLYQGAVEVHSFALTLTTSESLFTEVVPEVAAASITDYSALRIGLRATHSSTDFAVVDYVWLDLPDPGFAHLDLDPSGHLVVAAAGSGSYLKMTVSGDVVRVAGAEQLDSLVLVLDAGGNIVVRG